MDETGITIAGMHAFLLFIAYEPFQDRILGLHLAWIPSPLSGELFLKDLVKKYGRHPGWTDAVDWYPPAFQLMKLNHHVYLRCSWLWEITERAVQRLKDRTESFDDLFPYRSHRENFELNLIRNWINNVFWLQHQPMYKSFIRAIEYVLK